MLPKRKRLSHETQKLFVRLYLEGLATGDFEPVFRQLLGETAGLSPSTLIRLKAEWQAEYVAWRNRPLEHDRFVCIWADAIYLGAGLEKENSCVLTLIAARADGSKELIAMGDRLPGVLNRRGPTCCATCASAACEPRWS